MIKASMIMIGEIESQSKISKIRGKVAASHETAGRARVARIRAAQGWTASTPPQKVWPVRTVSR
jgi:hypothetical protein